MILSERGAQHFAKAFLISAIIALLAMGLSPLFALDQTRQEGVLKCSEEVFNLVVSELNYLRGFLDYASYGPARHDIEHNKPVF